ncbi:peptidoglycan DD-metalloendopeptidase family protein [Candidatus Palibaumannia cicadellinicola]|uniref:Lipoprotein NlpD n=1 Tax=Candidatus Palibaumannia cicadellinicola TaxID=186490 RepID=A0A088MXM4_9GAMM|nr:peptidoglycan DD-metalloendopeptidase family protein [Candidatus Baumannia cicadellinicola]AIN47120.1 Lipoprotein NlpD [Candidatus Baumannia cicadellinicola]
MISKKCSWRRIIVSTSMTTSLWLVGCASDEFKAPISHIGGNNKISSSYGNLNMCISTPRTNKTSNRRYNRLQKGSYSDSTYQIKNGDTLFYIAWITGKDVQYLAKINHIPEPYRLKVGTILQIGIGNGNSSSEKLRNVVALSSSTTVLTSNHLTASWSWPTTGKIIEYFSATEGGNKGVDISGFCGQPIIATANGKVVYAGNALRGYGNLIIIKHNDDYLSAYAHNNTMLVHEPQQVKAGQKIATMGSTGASSVRLHFEIRYHGKSVNPLLYLSENELYDNDQQVVK